eukprot:15446644-Alexandrium_andersonii.AAC.1
MSRAEAGATVVAGSAGANLCADGPPPSGRTRLGWSSRRILDPSPVVPRDVLRRAGCQPEDACGDS